MTPAEHQLAINDLSYSLQRWGEGNATPVLAIHGWLDNSESFAPLAQHLSSIDLVAPDLVGHGRSAHRPASGSYNLWDDLRDLLLIADALGWQRFSLIGHSRGAMIAMLLAASMPGRIASAVFIDGFWPIPEPVEKAPEQLGRHLREYNSNRNAQPFYADVEAAVSARQTCTRLPADVLRPMVMRNLIAQGDGWCWRTDSRLRYASAFKLTDDHNRAFAKAIECPGKVLLADKGMGKYESMVAAIGKLPNLDVQVLPGDHHLHMASPDALAGHLLPFFGG